MAPFKNSPRRGIFEFDESSMKANSVDRVSSLLTSMLVMVGLALFMLGLLFFLRVGNHSGMVTKPNIETTSSLGDMADGTERDFDPPEAHEVEQLHEPAIEQTLQLVSVALSDLSQTLESFDSNALSNNIGIGHSRGRLPGEEMDGGDGGDIVPRYKRWELKFQARDKKSYGLQLDFHKIELGAYGGTDPMVDYVSDITSQPSRRSGPPSADKRLYFLSATGGVLNQYDKQYLQSVGIHLASRTPIKFISKATEELLAQAEAKYYIENRSSDLSVAEIAKTVFESRPNPDGSGFAFVVVDQRYRGLKRK